MCKYLIVGNPNVGKSTLFNSLTKSNEHTGNFHGVTVDSKQKTISYNNSNYTFVDLPGMYSLYSASKEEQVARDTLLKSNATHIMLMDANSLKKNLYLALQLLELGIDFSILINNYDYFTKHKNKLDISKLQKILGKNIELINAKKFRINTFQKLVDKKFFQNSKKDINLSKYLQKFIENSKNKLNFNDKQIIFALNGIYDGLNNQQIEYFESLMPQVIEARYKVVDQILLDCQILQKDYVYGYSKLDEFLLNPFVMIIGSVASFLLGLYLIFFLLGPKLGDLFNLVLNHLVVNPIMNLLYLATDNVWLIEFFSGGVFSAFSTIMTFLPQICLMYLFITILEDSGLIARLSYVFDDVLTKFGLNGKAIYIMLLGLGCNTMSTMVCRNMSGKNMRTKSAVINPFLSCMARLPIYVIIASAFFGKLSFLVIAGIYILGIIIMLITSKILTKTILPNNQNNLMLEFPPLRRIDIKHVLSVCKTNALDMIKRIFGIIISMSIIIWILSHTKFNLGYTQTITDSILFVIAGKLTWIFKPIGLNNAGIVSALIVGIMAKELVVATFSITNNATNNSKLITSLLSSTSVIHFSLQSAISFIIFFSIYCPCISNLAVLKKETNSFYMWFTIVTQFTIAYLLSFVAYQMLTRGFLMSLISVIIIAVIMCAIVYICKTVSKKQSNCMHCTRCKNN